MEFSFKYGQIGLMGIRPNKKISLFLVTSLKKFGMIGTHLKKKILEKNIILCILKGEMPFKMHKIIFFSRNPEKI